MSREKEEKLFQAIGDLPEDMIADAANYRPPEKKDRRFGKWVQMGKGFVCAVCAAALIFGLVPWIYNIVRGGGQTDSWKEMMEEQESSSVFDYELATEDRREEVLYLWSENDDMLVEKESLEAEDGKKTKEVESGEKETSATKKIKEGKTVCLYVKNMPAEGNSGEEKKVLPFKIGKTGDGIKYIIHSAASNCRVSSITSGGVTKQIDASMADCAGGDSFELDFSEQDETKWEEAAAPEWDRKDIRVIGIVDITGEKEEETYDFGKIVIGKKGEKYYGLFQKKNN